MAETQVRQRNGFLPVINQFTDYLYKYMDQQKQLTNQLYTFNKKKQSDDFISQYGKEITKATSLEGLTSSLSKAITDAGSMGLENVLPILNSIAQIQQQKIGIEETKKQADNYVTTLENTFGNSKTIINGEIVPVKEAIENLRSRVSDPLSLKMNAEFIAKNILKEFKTILPTDKGYSYSEGYVGADNKVYGGRQYNIYEEKGKVMTDYGKAGDKTDDKELDPLVAKEYGIYKKQDKQLASYLSRTGSSGSGGINTQPSKWYEDPKDGQIYPTWWDKKANRYKRLVDGKEVIITDTQNVKDRSSTTAFKEMAIANMGIINQLQTIAKDNNAQEGIQMLNQMMVMNPGFYKTMATEDFEDYARALATEMGDNWENPNNPQLKELKKRFSGNKPNAFLNFLNQSFNNIDSVYATKTLQD